MRQMTSQILSAANKIEFGGGSAKPRRRSIDTEGPCAVIWHLLVSHPALKIQQTKWETVYEQKG